MASAQIFRPLLVELKVNPRLRAGLWVVIGILWFYGLLTLQEEVNKKAETYQATVKKIVRTQSLAAQKEWPSRLEAVRFQQELMENRLWRQFTIGLAQASFQDWLKQTAEQVHLDKALVTVAVQDDYNTDKQDAAMAEETAQPIYAEPLWKVSAKIIFDFNPKSFYPFLERLATHEKGIIVESLIVRGAPVPRVELGLVAYFHKPSGSEVNRAATQRPEDGR